MTNKAEELVELDNLIRKKMIDLLTSSGDDMLMSDLTPAIPTQCEVGYLL